MPISVTTMILASASWLAGWYAIGKRMKDSGVPSEQVRLLHKAFLFTGIFFGIIALSNISLAFVPEKFPLIMAIGLTVGHAFLFTSFVYFYRVMVSMVPSVNRWWKRAYVGLGVLISVATVVTMAITSIFVTRPEHNFESQVTIYNIAPIVGIGITVLGILAYMPSSIMFIVNGVRNADARVKSFLLAAGLIIQLVGGPLHSFAENVVMYMMADVINMLGAVVLAGGVLYSFNRQLAPAKKPVPEQQQQPTGT